RVVLRFHPELAPIKIAVLPLRKKRPELVATCHDLRHRLTRRWLTLYDDTAAIRPLYRRQDEVGTPRCLTVDVKTAAAPEKAAPGSRGGGAVLKGAVPVGGGPAWGPPGVPGTGAGIAGRRPQAGGSVPRTNAIVTTRTHSFDGSRSTGTRTTLSGTAKSSRGLSPRTLPMYETQIGTATREPVSSLPRLRGRS